MLNSRRHFNRAVRDIGASVRQSKRQGMLPDFRTVDMDNGLNNIVLGVNTGVGQGFGRRFAQSAGLKPVLVGFRFDDKAIMFGTELFNMSGLSSADDELIATRIDSLADIAEPDVVVSFRNLSDKVKSDGNSAPGVDFGQ